MLVIETTDSLGMLQCLAPYTVTTPAKYFMYHERHTLTIYDDPSNKHKLINKCLFYYKVHLVTKLIP